ncbi:cryptochrome/photolyase family protein [Plebeiibacterium marinum]|uniref:DNA photolyase family protein n=1 Tax=Plebeiibacterium marinum TaxID=2992111 RepID=A0AAE3MED8_9BACT|nr:deoxyribodipyrimidine photo-lyase [Plebeiobacterium marinum]MCW3806067.1 DNA photolyase family protein [Plebeiobacterium marinum]
MAKEKVSIFWFRRDLRLDDNYGFYKSLNGNYPVLPLFIFDTDITDKLAVDDSRIGFIYELLSGLSDALRSYSSGILVKKGKPYEVWNELLGEYDVRSVYANEDYEPYGIQRDELVKDLLSWRSIPFSLYKDHVIFAKADVLKNDGSPYAMYTAYKNRWLRNLAECPFDEFPLVENANFIKRRFNIPTLTDLGFVPSGIKVVPYSFDCLKDYDETRDYPALNGSSKLGPFLRFGALSIRKVFRQARYNETFLNELIWREFFIQVLYHFPLSANKNFKEKYDGIKWRNNLEEFEKWKCGETGYLLVDAGMRELNATGYMHNRVRMVVASFLCKHLLIDWRWGERFFAEKLLDFELASNVGNWQWVAGTGCDSAPYFRVFNPIQQAVKFDPQMEYIKKWLTAKEIKCAKPMVEHKYARERAIYTYRAELKPDRR